MKNYKILIWLFFIFLFLSQSCIKEKRTSNTNVIEVNGDLDFGRVSINTSSSEKLFSIRNTGNTNVAVSSISAPTGFFISGWSSGSISAGETKEVKVKFTPTEIRTYSGDIVIVSNASSSPNKINLYGEGISGGGGPTISWHLSRSSIDFGSRPIGSSYQETFTIINDGNNALTNININCPTGAFSVNSTGLNTTLNANSQSAPISVIFNPTAAQTYPSTTITISANGGSEQKQLVVTGAGTNNAPTCGITNSPNNLSFGTVSVGSSLTQNLSITNTCTNSLLFSIATEPNSVIFILPNGPYNNVAIAAGNTITIPVKFSPQAAGSYSAQIKISTTAGQVSYVPISGTGTISAPPCGMSYSPSSLSFGNVNVGNSSTQNINITNTCNSSLIFSVTAEPNNGAFSLPNGPYNNLSMAPTLQLPIPVKFNPTSAGNYSGQIKITTTAGQVSYIPVSGFAVGAPALLFSPVPLDFGNFIVNSSSAFTNKYLRITNTGTADLIINSGSSNNSSFVLDVSMLPLTIQPNTYRDIKVTFTSIFAYGVYSGSLSFNTNIGQKTTSVMGTAIPFSTPQLGYFGNCEGQYNDGCTVTHGLIRLGIVNFNYPSNTVTFQMQRCDGTPFVSGGTLYIIDGLSGSCNYNTPLGQISFSAGQAFVNVTVPTSNMYAGNKFYYGLLNQNPGWSITQQAIIQY